LVKHEWKHSYKFYNLNNSYLNKIKKAIINANKPTASVNANPNIANLNKLFNWSGFLDTAINKDPNTTPTPAPAPTRPIVAKPAPNNLK